MSLVNFVVVAIPRLSRLVPTPVLLAAGTATTLAGMAWLSRAGVDGPYLASVAAPMVLIGAGQGLAFAPLINAAIGLCAAKRGHSWESAAVSFAVVFATNVVLVAIADPLRSRGEGRLQLIDTLFFVFLFSILTTLYDRYRPIHDYRVDAARTETTA
jgi:hypothetical protein